MVNEKRLVDEFTKLVAIDAETYEERKMADYLLHKLKQLGLSAGEDKTGELLAGRNGTDKSKSAGNIYAYLKGNKAGEPILLSAHMDTVRPGKGKQAVIHEDGKITSGGNTVLGADDYAGVAAILEALHVIKENNILHPDIEVLFMAAEELYCQGSRHFDYSKVRSKTAYTFDLSGNVGTAAISAPSILSLRIKVSGQKAHAGFCPQQGIHAIKIAANAVSKIENGFISDDTTVNLGTIQGGTATNIVPDKCIILGEIRSMVHEKAIGQAEKIKAIFQREAKALGGEVSVEVVEEFKAYNISEEEKVVQHFLNVCRKQGLESKLVETFGGSDNNHFVANGIRGIVAACAMNDVHTTNEYTTIEELKRSAQVALGLLTE